MRLGLHGSNVPTSEIGYDYPSLESLMVDAPWCTCGPSKRRSLNVRPLNIAAFKSELSRFPFLSEDEKVHPPKPQTWKRLRYSKLRRYPTCQNVSVERLIDDHGMEGYVFEVKIDGDGPFALKVFKQVHRPRSPHIWPFLRECLYYSRAEIVNAGVSSGKSLPEGPPPTPYTLNDMLRFLQSFSSDHEAWTNEKLGHQGANSMQVRKIISDMDGSLGWIRLDYEDMNNVIRKWGLDTGYSMNGTGFREHPFGIVKKLIVSDASLDNQNLLRWLDLAQYMGYDLHVFEPRNWMGEGILVDAGDVLTLPFQGTWQNVAQSYQTIRAKFLADLG